jgi:uncharacterized membrane protein required for colicin V production
MAPIDVVCAAILLAAAIRVAVRGFVAEVFSVGAVVAGLAAAVVGHPLAARQLGEWWGAGWWNVVVAAVVLFVAGYLLVKLVEAMFEGFFNSLRLQGLDRILGLAMGAAEGLIVVYLLLFLLHVQTVVDTESWFTGSLVQELLLPRMLEIMPFPALPSAQEAPFV